MTAHLAGSLRDKVDINIQVFDILKAIAQITEEGMIEVLEHFSFPNDISHAF